MNTQEFHLNSLSDLYRLHSNHYGGWKYRLRLRKNRSDPCNRGGLNNALRHTPPPERLLRGRRNRGYHTLQFIKQRPGHDDCSGQAH